MRAVALVTLDCVNGRLKRYTRGPNNKPMETGRDKFKRWIVARKEELQVFDLIQAFRAAWTPPEEPGPRPTSPLKTAIAA